MTSPQALEEPVADAQDQPDEQDQPEEGGYDLVMPFVAVQSVGGPYDDQAFAAGYQCGQLDHVLAVAMVSGAAVVAKPFVYSELAKQLDLIAMQYGYTAELQPHDETWASVIFRRTE